MPLTKAAPGPRRRRGRYMPFLISVSPWVIGTLVLTVYPLIYALQVSFTNWDGQSEYAEPVGLANYTELLGDPMVWAALGRTAVLTLVMVPFTIVGSLLLALLLNQKVPGLGIFRTLIYLPAVVPVVGASMAWKMIFDRDAGAVNGVLGALGVETVPNWMTGNLVFVVMLIMLAWGVGGGVILDLAALQGVPVELHDAAKIDGANAWQSFKAVTLPAVSPVLVYQIITGVIAAMQTYLPALLLTSGVGAAQTTAVPESNRVYMVEVYDQFFAYGRYGYGSAMLWVLFALVLVITAATFRFSANAVHYESGVQ